MTTFVTARIREDLQAAEDALRGYDTESTGHMTSPKHSAFAVRFNPKWVIRKCLFKMDIIKVEIAKVETIRDAPVSKPLPPYQFPYVRLLAIRWSDHPDFDQRWLGKPAT